MLIACSCVALSLILTLNPKGMFPGILILITSLIFLYYIFMMPYEFNILPDKQMLRCKSLGCDIDIPVYSIRVINISSKYNRVQIGSIEYGEKKIIIHTGVRWIEQIVVDLKKINQNIIVDSSILP